MKRLILVVIVICFLAGVVTITSGKLQSQNFQTEEKIEQNQLERSIPPKPRVDTMPQPTKGETSSPMETQKIFRLKVWMKSEQEQNIVERIGLPCQGKIECLCHATEEQVEELKKEGIEFKVEREALRIRKTGTGKGQVHDYNDIDYDIPDDDGWVASPITISTAPAGAVVTRIDVCYDIAHTYIGDLIVDLTDEDETYAYRLWYREGGSGDNISECDSNVTLFNGELVNQTWYLWAKDCAPEDVGYIDCWEIWIWYEELLPDLIVQSLTATDYNPNVGDYIDVTMVIKNQGAVPAFDWFCNGLFYNLSGPPDIDSLEDDWWWTSDLDPGETESYTFCSITSSEAETWRMYGLADCDGEIAESNENNNYIGPVTVNWTYVPPDLVVQSLTVDDASLVITEHTNGTITIKNQSSVPVTQEFRTDVFKNRTTAPYPPVSGQYRLQTYSLGAGETRTYNFYKLPHSTSAGTWKMWGLVDSQGDIEESNEGNNAYGPLYITWSDPPWPPDEVTRATIIDHALEFVNVNWTCSNANTTPHWSCPNDWKCRFAPGQHTGEAYSWGGWDKPDDFLTYLSAGLRAGAVKDSVDSLCGQADPYWATGVECAGLVCRCWELPSRRETQYLPYVSDQITMQELQSGDILNKPYVHVRMFYQWYTPKSVMTVIEATPDYCQQQDYDTLALCNDGYVPRRYKYVDDPGQQDPEIVGHIHCKYPEDECGDCVKYGEEITIELDAYDPDGDSMYYEWYSYWGWFIVDGETTYWDTTAQNFITYLAPGFPYTWDRLSVTVHDVRGGWASIEGWLGIYDPGTSCRCGDCNDDGAVNLADAVCIVSYLYTHGPQPLLMETGDINNDCVVNIADAVYIVTYLFQYGPLPVCGWICPPYLKTPNSVPDDQTSGKVTKSF